MYKRVKATRRAGSKISLVCVVVVGGTFRHHQRLLPVDRGGEGVASCGPQRAAVADAADGDTGVKGFQWRPRRFGDLCGRNVEGLVGEGGVCRGGAVNQGGGGVLKKISQLQFGLVVKRL